MRFITLECPVCGETFEHDQPALDVIGGWVDAGKSDEEIVENALFIAGFKRDLNRMWAEAEATNKGEQDNQPTLFDGEPV